MTNETWRTSSDARSMIRYAATCVSRQRLVLAAAACARIALRRSGGDASQKAVEIAERWAEGKATVEEVAAARDAAQRESSAAASSPFGESWSVEPWDVDGNYAAVSLTEVVLAADDDTAADEAVRVIDYAIDADRGDCASAIRSVLLHMP